MEKNLSILNDLCLVANNLDKKGFYKEASDLDKIVATLAFESDLITEASLEDFLAGAGRMTGRALTGAGRAAKRVAELTWKRAVKPAASKTLGAFRKETIGTLLVALLANAAGSYGVTPMEAVRFLTKGENSNILAEKVWPAIEGFFVADSIEYKIVAGDNLNKIVRKQYPDIVVDQKTADAVIDIIVEMNEMGKEDILNIGDTLLMPTERALEKIKDSGEKVIEEETAKVDEESSETSTEGDGDFTIDDMIRFASGEEKWSSKQYKDQNGYLTIGIGHLIKSNEKATGKIIIDGEEVEYKNGLTKEQVIKLYEQDKESHAKAFDKILESLDVDPEDFKKSLKPNELFALNDVVFNIGGSTSGPVASVLKKAKADPDGLTGETAMKWLTSRLRADKGIWGRRLAEYLWFRGVYLQKSGKGGYVDIIKTNGGKYEKSFVFELIDGIAARPELDTEEEFIQLVKDVADGKTFDRVGPGR